MNEPLAGVVDRARRDATGQNIEDAAGGGKLDLAPNVSDA
jgi:hypothetical protein